MFKRVAQHLVAVEWFVSLGQNTIQYFKKCRIFCSSTSSFFSLLCLLILLFCVFCFAVIKLILPSMYEYISHIIYTVSN